jgi:hypothetical protein
MWLPTTCIPDGLIENGYALKLVVPAGVCCGISHMGSVSFFTGISERMPNIRFFILCTLTRVDVANILGKTEQMG